MKIEVTRIQIQGERTPFSARFDDVYFAEDSGIPESQYLYLEGSGFLQSLQNSQQDSPLKRRRISIGEIGFGVGLNFLLTYQAFRERAKPGQQLYYASAEQFPVHRDDLAALYARYPELQAQSSELLNEYPLLTPGIHRIRLWGGRVILDLLLGSAIEMFRNLDATFDHWYWDGFAPSKNPEAFSTELFQTIAARSQIGAQGSSFTSAGWVRRGLEEAGFQVTKREGFGRKRECLQAVLERQPPPVSLTPPWFSCSNLNPVPLDQSILVAGAGLAGSAVARSLAERGYRVRVFDPLGVAARASGNRAGLFNVQMSRKPNPISRFSQGALAHFLRELRRLQVPHHLGIQRWDTEDHQALRASDYPADFFSVNESGVFLPFCGFLNPMTLCRQRLAHPNIEVIPEAISENQDGAPIVFALGSDLKLLSQNLQAPLYSHVNPIPTRPIRGQVLELAPSPASQTIRHTQVHHGYVTPIVESITGSPVHLLGATYQAKEIQPDQVARDQSFLIEEARRSWKEFSTLTDSQVVGYREGYRLSTPDKLPLIGPLADEAWFTSQYSRALRGSHKSSSPHAPPALEPIPGQFCLLGLGSRGITFSSYGAEILTALISGEPLPVELDLWEHLHPMRFLARGLKRTTPGT